MRRERHSDRRKRASGRRSACPRDEGFTLLEVLVALTILGFSLAILLAIFAQSLDRTRNAELRMEARVLAQSLLREAEATPSGQLKAATGQTPDGFTWRIQLEPYGTASDRASWKFAPVLVSTTVSWQVDGHAGALSLSTIRLLHKVTQT